MKTALITTTIHVPRNLEAYAKDISEYGPSNAAIVIAGDMKTPPEIAEFCKELQDKHGVPVIYLSPEDQVDLFGGYAKTIPWNCIQRRNLAILYAYNAGAEVIATIDDDNFWEGEGYFKGHNITGTPEQIEIWNTPDGWFNACDSLRAKNDIKFFPRGFSLKRASTKESEKEGAIIDLVGKVVVNAGLWLGEPDIDAVTRLAVAPEVISFDNLNIALGFGTKCPFNSQNTALHRSVIPAYCLPYGLGRYDDIIASYIVKRIADHLGDYIRFGNPIVRQIRNAHDIWKDLEDEKIGMQLTDRIVEWLYEIPLTGKDYAECIGELIPAFREKYEIAASLKPIKFEQFQFLRNIVEGYDEWMKVT